MKTISKNNNIPIVISTWKHGHKANIAAWDILINNGSFIYTLYLAVSSRIDLGMK